MTKPTKWIKAADCPPNVVIMGGREKDGHTSRWGPSHWDGVTLTLVGGVRNRWNPVASGWYELEIEDNEPGPEWAGEVCP